MSNNTIEGPMPVTVSFQPRLRTDGELVKVALNQGANLIELTHEQARTLVQVISARCSL